MKCMKTCTVMLALSGLLLVTVALAAKDERADVYRASKVIGADVENPQGVKLGDIRDIVLDPATTDFKTSAREFMDRADAGILHETRNGEPAWKDVSLKPIVNKPMFQITPPPYVTPEVIDFVRSKLR